MTADELLQFLTQAIFVLVFVCALASAVRQPQRTKINIALLFGALAYIVAWQWIGRLLHIGLPPLVSALNGGLVITVPYLLLRLLSDFSEVPFGLVRGAEIGVALSAAALLLTSSGRTTWVTLGVLTYFVALTVYDAVMFAREARRTGGVTRRRMQAVALGSLFLGVTVLLAALAIALPSLGDFWSVLIHLGALASGVAYYLGFAPPRWLRRAWQGPELREVLGRAARLPRLPDTNDIVAELEQGTARSLGAPCAAIGLWDGSSGMLRFPHGISGTDAACEIPPRRMITGRCFLRQQPLYSPNISREDPEHADLYESTHTRSVLVAPITAGERRLGVLRVASPREPIFAEDDLELVQLLASQAAIVLESRALIDEAARVQAREEATRLKDDFLSAAAHDLRTPLTTLIGQAQLMERRALRNPDAPADLSGIRRIVGEGKRLGVLVQELLDARRAEQGRLVSERAPVDLVHLAHKAGQRQSSSRHSIVISADEPVIGMYDDVRLMQLLDNLLENAVKYTPEGGDIHVRIWREGQQAHVSVADPGIGIPWDDLPLLFDRFHRGANVDDRRFAGMGLGLYICRGIAEQHGGQIWAESPGPDRGTVIHVTFPVGLSEPSEVGSPSGG